MSHQRARAGGDEAGGMAGQNTEPDLKGQRQGTQGGDAQGAPSALDRAIGILRDAGYSIDATARATASGLTFGQDDRVSAGLNALAPSSDGSTWRQRYEANLAAE